MNTPEQFSAVIVARRNEGIHDAIDLLERRPDLADLTAPGTVMAELGWSA